MMELIPAGICRVMPSSVIADILNRAYELRRADMIVDAFQLYEKVLPQIVFSLQNLELFLYCETRLLHARGLLSNARCRNACFTPDPSTVDYVNELNDRILREIQKAGLADVASGAVLECGSKLPHSKRRSNSTGKV